jgi:hypothetical protein
MNRVLKPKRCRICAREFTPISSMSKVCSVHCSMEWSRRVAAKKAEQEARTERKKMREAKERLKTRREWIAEAQVAVNRVVRFRDLLAGHGCISCGAHPQQRYGGAVDAGHYRSVGSAPHLRFYLPNIRAQCKKCNRELGGSHTNYRIGLIDRIGIERVEQIEAMQGNGKWSIDYLRRLKQVMNRKAKRLERRITKEKTV